MRPEYLDKAASGCEVLADHRLRGASIVAVMKSADFRRHGYAARRDAVGSAVWGILVQAEMGSAAMDETGCVP